MSKKILSAVFLIAIMVILVGIHNADAVTIDLWDSFPDSQGENGFYAYAYSGTYRTLADIGDHYFGTPEHINMWQVPVVSQISTGWIQLHPSANYQCAYYFPPEDAVLAWVVPDNGKVDLSGMFFNEGHDGDGVEGYIKKNVSTVWNHYVHCGETWSFDLSDIYVNKNDVLYFSAYSGPAGGDIADWGRLKGSIEFSPLTAVPEPASILLFGIGTAAAIFLRKRR